MTSQPHSQQSSPKTAPATLTIERTFNATPERLWAFWTEPKKYAKWLNPAPMDLVIHEFDVRVGGKIRFDMPQPDGNKNPQEGVFHKLAPFTEIVSGAPDKSFLIRAQFIPVTATSTRLRVDITGVPPEYHAMATTGWNAGLDKLERELGSASSSRSAARATADRYVEMERFYKAAPEKVYAAWTTPAMLEKFFWPVGEGKLKEFSLKPGGRLVMGHATQPWTATWAYKEIVPNKKLVFSDLWDDGSGHVATGSMEFIAERGGTLVRVRHGPFPTTGPYQPEAALGGFSMVGDRLAELLEVPGPGEGFVLVRHFNAPPEKVWAMWTTPGGLDKWWKLSAKDMGFEFKVVKLDVRVGGAYDLMMKSAAQGELHNHGVYTEVVANKRLAQRWDFDIFLGPDEKPYPITIGIDFEAEPTMEPGKMGTKMTFRQGPMAKPGFTEGSRQGVIANFAKLEKALAS